MIVDIDLNSPNATRKLVVTAMPLTNWLTSFHSSEKKKRYQCVQSLVSTNGLESRVQVIDGSKDSKVEEEREWAVSATWPKGQTSDAVEVPVQVFDSKGDSPYSTDFFVSNSVWKHVYVPTSPYLHQKLTFKSWQDLQTALWAAAAAGLSPLCQRLVENSKKIKKSGANQFCPLKNKGEIIKAININYARGVASDVRPGMRDKQMGKGLNMNKVEEGFGSSRKNKNNKLLHNAAKMTDGSTTVRARETMGKQRIFDATGMEVSAGSAPLGYCYNSAIHTYWSLSGGQAPQHYYLRKLLDTADSGKNNKFSDFLKSVLEPGGGSRVWAFSLNGWRATYHWLGLVRLDGIHYIVQANFRYYSVISWFSGEMFEEQKNDRETGFADTTTLLNKNKNPTAWHSTIIEEVRNWLQNYPYAKTRNEQDRSSKY
jgi:hypothetical protein